MRSRLTERRPCRRRSSYSRRESQRERASRSGARKSPAASGPGPGSLRTAGPGHHGPGTTNALRYRRALARHGRGRPAVAPLRPGATSWVSRPRCNSRSLAGARRGREPLAHAVAADSSVRLPARRAGRPGARRGRGRRSHRRGHPHALAVAPCAQAARSRRSRRRVGRPRRSSAAITARRSSATRRLSLSCPLSMRGETHEARL